VWAGGGQGCGPESGSAFTGPGHCGASVGRSAAAHRAGVPTRVPYGPNHARRAGTGGSTRVRHCASASHLHNYAKCACPARLEPSKLDDPGHRGGSAGVNLAAQGRGGGGGCYGVGVCVWGDPDRADAGAGAARGVQVHNMACTTAPGGALGHPRRGPLHCVPRTAQTRAHTCRPTHPPWVDGVPARVAHLHRDPAQPVPPQGSRPRGLTEPLWGRPDPRSWRCASCWEVPGQGQPGQGCRQGPPSPSLGGAGARGAHPSPPRRRRPSAG
jgi:hypothetical protein